jgi:hypothetical protein
MSDRQETPCQEAISIISNVPVLSAALFFIAKCVYNIFPALSSIRAPQMPYVIASVAAGCAFFVVTVPFAGLFASWLSSAHVANIERQTSKLVAARKKIKKRRRDRDGFNVR